MRFNAQYFVFCSALTLTAACSDDAGTPIGTGGATAGGAGAGGAAAGAGGNATAGTSAGMPSGGVSVSGAGMAGAGMGGGGAGGAGTGGMGGGGAAGMGGMGGAAPVPVCGNGKKEGTEACDDGNKVAKDGCSDTCTVEDGYDCAYEGMACKPICGDGKVIAPEKCDDKNTASGDGCSNDCATIEKGFECKTAGAACTTVCGDGVLAGAELCDDGNIKPSDGCDAACAPEVGFVCDIPGQSCRTQPDCTGGSCKSACGDGLVISEDCDDGNLVDNDGCSSTCQVEQGFTCKIVDAPPPAQLAIPVMYRDFIATAMGGSTKFPDQIAFQGQGITPGMVEAKLDNEGLPVYTGICEQGGPNENDAQKCPYGAQTTSKANFDMWYRDTDGVNLPFPGVVKLDRVGMTSAYVFDGGSTFTPLTGIGWDKLGKEALNDNRNFGFTTELRYFFMYQGDEVLDFSGDDDVWVFINGKLAVDIGGLHPKQTQSVTLGVQKSQELGLTVGKVYELALFHAERRPGSSNFKLTLTGFLNSISKCTKN